MYAQVEKPRENQNKVVANSVAQNQSGGEPPFQFVDNRPEAIVQRKLQEMANNQTVQKQHPIQKKENKTGLPDKLKSGIENLSGYSMDDVKVHYNSDKPAQLHAHAYAQGTDIHLTSGQEKHLPHEAWHVVQQKQGRGKPTIQVKGIVSINDDAGLEKEADLMGAKALQRQPKIRSVDRERRSRAGNENIGQRMVHSYGGKNPIQRITYLDAKGGVGADNEADLDTWVKDKSGSDETGEWDVFLQNMDIGDVKGRLRDYTNQKGLTETASDYKSYTELKVMTLRGFDGHADDQVDWHARPDLSGPQRDTLRSMLMFARSGNLGPCGGMKIEDLQVERDKATDEGTFFEYMGLYSTAVKDKVPIRLSRTSDVEKAVKIGENLKKLTAAFGGTILKGALPEHEFDLIIHYTATDELIDYYQNTDPTPIFQAKNGRDFFSFLVMKNNEGKNPKDYDAGDLHTAIRNYHRFTKATLVKLVTNYGDTSKAKPLTLILHTAIDHNGAFHRDPKLEAVITNGNIHSIMIEGKETLDDVKSKIQPLARKYGKNNKIDQVMIAGHGNARSIQLGGKLTGGGELNEKEELKEDSDAVNLINNEAKARELFDEVLDNMDIDPGFLSRIFGSPPARQEHRRILFNACLTNSNYVSTALDNDDPSRARRAIREYLNQNKNLVSYAKTRAEAKNSWGVTVRGSSASHGRVDMLDTRDNLDLISAADPKLTAPKLEYVEFGTEPTGALRAVLECWSADSGSARTELQQAMQRRIAKNSKAWRDCIIETLYSIAIKYLWSKGLFIKHLSLLAGELSHNQSQTNCKVANFGCAEKLGQITEHCFNALRGANEWSSQNYIPLVFYQVWIKMDLTSKPYKEFVDHLGTEFNCADADKFVDTSYMAPKMSAVLAGGGSQIGKLKLALLGVHQNKNADCKQYLVGLLYSQVSPLTKDKFDPLLNIDALLGGVSTEDNILINIGKKQAPVLEQEDELDLDIGADAKSGNITLEGDDRNKYYIESITKKGIISKSSQATAYRKPDTASDSAGLLDKDAPVSVIGANYDWWAIEFTYASARVGTAFIPKADLSLK
ncbi:MAG: DUF4157 domain-containing protein [Deltaproteobacteria bacterium]|nr:DUF4157 domain-containing protein [Deltaproteobacteria bacterium]